MLLGRKRALMINAYERLKRREGESILDAIQRLSNYRYRLYRMRDHHEEEDEETWREELRTCNVLLDDLWELRRLELRMAYEDADDTTPPGQLISEARAGVVRRRSRFPKLPHSLFHQAPWWER